MGIFPSGVCFVHIEGIYITFIIRKLDINARNINENRRILFCFQCSLKTNVSVTVRQQRDLTLSFYSWNPSTGSDLDGLWADAAGVLGPDRTSGCYRGHLKGTFYEGKKYLLRRDFSVTSPPDEFAFLCLSHLLAASLTQVTALGTRPVTGGAVVSPKCWCHLASNIGLPT